LVNEALRVRWKLAPTEPDPTPRPPGILMPFFRRSREAPWETPQLHKNARSGRVSKRLGDRLRTAVLRTFGGRKSIMAVPAYKKPSKIYICHIDHEHDRTYTENVVEYLNSKGVSTEVVQLVAGGLRPELEACLDDPEAAVLSFNFALDHSWVTSGPFLEEAERRGVPVVQWILDHPSSRWAEFYASTATNSRFLLNSEQQQRYFETYCLPGALTGTRAASVPTGEPALAS
jgi:hypothetical protein